MLVDSPGIVTVTGSGGIGKTTLVEHATAEPASWSKAMVERSVVMLAETSRADLVLPAIAAAVRIGGFSDESLSTRLQLALSAATRLLVLDNFEHLIGAADDIARLAHDCPELRIVVTSRMPLRVSGERILEVPPLAEAVAPFTAEQPPMAMFAEVATRIDPDFTIAGNERVIASICSRLDGVPLSIELAAARTATLSPTQIDELLADGAHLAVLRRGPQDGPARQRDMEATVAWSYELLDGRERTMLGHLSTFSGWFDFNDVAAMERGDIGDVLDALAALVDAHLVMSVESAARRTYRLPVPVREFVIRRLATDAEEVRRVATASRTRLIGLATEAMVATEGPSAHLGIARLADAEGDLVGGLEVALSAEDSPHAAVLAPALCALWFHRGMFAAMRPMLAATVDLVERAASPPADRAHVRGWLALLDAESIFDGRDPARIEKALVQAADMARAAGDLDIRLRTNWFVTLASRTVHNFDSAIAAAEEGMALADEARRDIWLGRFEAEAGMVAQKVGEDERSAMLGVQALRRGQANGDAATIVRAIAVLRPPVGRWTFEPPPSCPSLAEALELAIATGDAHARRYLYPMAAGASLRDGHPRVAAQYCAGGLRDALNSGNAYYGRINAFMLSAVAANASEWELAAELHGMIVEYWPRISRGLAVASRDVSDRSFARLRHHLGTDRYDAACARGAARPIRVAMSWALHHADRFGGDVSAAGGSSERPLTDRELAVLRLVAQGMSNKQIASALGITAKTAMHHTSHIYRKLGVSGRVEASALAIRLGLMSDP